AKRKRPGKHVALDATVSAAHATAALCRVPAASVSLRPLRGPAFELTNKKLTECLIYRKPGLEVRVRLTDQLQRIQVSQKVEKRSVAQSRPENSERCARAVRGLLSTN